MFDHQSGQYLEVDGAKIYFEEAGNPDKPVLLLLHGGFQSITDLNTLVKPRLADFRIIGIDSRGHGRSTLGTQPLTYERIQFDVEAVLKNLDIDTVNVLGFSDGGVVAYRLAACKVIRVEKLITIGASWCLNDVLAGEPMYQEINAESAKEIFQESFEDYQKHNPKPDFDALTQATIEMWLDKTLSGQPNEAISEIETETLIIRGDQDFLVSLESAVEATKLIKNSAFLNIPFAEHVVYEEQEMICERVISQFLAQ